MAYQVQPFSKQNIEVHDWEDRAEYLGLVSDFARVHVLLSIFDGDINKWLEMIDTVGSRTERLADGPFLRTLQQRLAREPRLLDDLRRAVSDFAGLVTPRLPSA
jgi:hypothetical protein